MTKIVVEPKYVDGKPTLTLLEGTYCTECGAFLAPPRASDDERINKAIEHSKVCKGKHQRRKLLKRLRSSPVRTHW